jgi:HEAT repeat protein
MRSLRQRLTIAGCFAATIAIMMIMAAVVRQREPRYQNRSLSEWLSTFRDLPGVRDSSPEFNPEFIQATEAIRHIGPEAIPYLLARFKHQSKLSKARDFIGGHLLRMRPRAIFVPLGVRLLDVERNQLGEEAVAGFQALGTNAASAIPQLFRLATHPTQDNVPRWATQALGRIGPKALPELVQIITNRHAPARFAAFPLRNFGTNVLPAVPAILESMTDPGYASDFGPTLHDLGLPPTTSVQVLIAALQAENSVIRASAAKSLGTRGTAAAAAAPTLRALLLDGDQLVRQESTNALLKIAPNLLTNISAQ